MEENRNVAGLEALAARIRSVSTIPDVAEKILEITASPTSSVKSLEDIIMADPMLSSKILRMANSAYFGLRNPVVEIRKAIVMLGFKTVRELALSASVCESFRSGDVIGSYSRSGLWEHCVGVAVVSRMISERCPAIQFEDSLFTMGILHDIGLIMMDQYLHDSFCKVMEHPELSSRSLPSIEREVMGFSHEELASVVAKRWKLPEVIVEVIRYHHSPREAQKFSSNVAVVFLANTICNHREKGFIESGYLDPMDYRFALNELGFGSRDLQIIMDDVDSEFEKASELFELVHQPG
jgi:putative nucleotidyltransferase with HDIG domain